MVTAPANTGKERSNSTAVIKIDQGKSLIRSKASPKVRVFLMVLIKFTAPRREEIPAKCREKIAKSTEAPLCLSTLLRGGYTVHPVPAPLSTALLRSRENSAGMRNQKLILFIRGKAISGEPIIKGISQLPNPPIIMGMIMKKIITNAWAVTKTL